MERTRSKLAAIAALLLVFAACGGAETETDTDQPVDGQQGDAAAGSIEVWIMQPGTEAVENIVRDQVEAFQQDTGATVDLQFVPWPAAHDQFVTSIAGDRTPDVAEMGTTWTPEFGEMGALAAVQTGEQDFVESLVESGTIEGETLGAPWYAGARALIYRSDVFEDLGLEPPQTWDELIEAGKVIDDQTDLFPFGVIGGYTHLYLPMIWQWGGEIAVETGGTWESRINSPEAVEAWTTYADLFERGWAPEGALGWNSADLREAFAAGDFAMMIGGGWDLSAILDSAPDLEGKVESVLTPEGPAGNRAAFAGGSHFVIFEGSDNPDLAQQFINHMLEEERVAEFATELGFLPGTESGIEASGLLDDPLYSPFAEQLRDHSRTYPASGAWGTLEGEGVFVTAMEQILGGERTVEEALNEVAERMNEAFAG
ncbi:MAG: sugar ABC transporter substrate-binding protein [Actinomycetota bacterium]|nr:sugar ABC transporter substrate-binding protein [Actinomycetota bacterium]